jgi:hypothetical protein
MSSELRPTTDISHLILPLARTPEQPGTEISRRKGPKMAVIDVFILLDLGYETTVRCGAGMLCHIRHHTSRAQDPLPHTVGHSYRVPRSVM